MFAYNFSSSSSSDDENLGDNRNARERRPKVYRPRINFDRLPHDNVSRFRLQDYRVDFLVERIGPFLQHDTYRNHALSPEQQIRIALRYFAFGSRYIDVGDAQGIHKATVCRCIWRVAAAVNEHILPGTLGWPEDENAVRHIANEFHKVAGMPLVLGCVDGTHVVMNRPNVDADQYVNK